MERLSSIQQRFNRAQSGEFEISGSGSNVASPVSKASIVPPVSSARKHVSSTTQPSVLPPIKPLSGPFSPPDWAIEPAGPTKFLEVEREGKIINKIALKTKAHVLGRHASCDTVCEHTSLSR